MVTDPAVSPERPPASLVQPAPPEVSTARAEALAHELFDLTANARSLGSHQDRNFLLETAPGAPRLLLKVSNPATTREELIAQNRAAELLSRLEPDIAVTRSAVRQARGDGVRDAVIDGETALVRLLEFVEGDPLSGGGYLAPRLLRAIGDLAARTSIALADAATDPAIAAGTGRASQWDLRRAPTVLAELLPYVTDPALRISLETAAVEAWAVVASLTGSLPEQVIHGDLTDDNIVATGTGTSEQGTSDAGTSDAGAPRLGIIDLGDLGRSWAVAELAICVSSVLHHAGGGIGSALRVVRAFHERRPLSPAEARVLWPLVVVRGAVLVASGHHVGATDPGNDYASENLRHEITIVERSTALPLAVTTGLVLDAVGLAEAPPILEGGTRLIPSLAPAAVALLDLSPTSPLLHSGRWLEPGIEDTLATETLTGGASAALTRFLEPRLTHSGIHSSAEPDNVALGLDLTVREPHDVVAPWAGTIEAIDGELVLSSAAGTRLRLRGLASPARPGNRVAAGDVIGTVEARLRIAVDAGAAPATAHAPDFTTASHAPGWTSVAVDPSALLLEAAPALPERSSALSRELLDRRRAHLADVQEHYFEDPPVMVRGWREHLVDADGRVYLDVLNNVTSIGHAHPRLVDAVAGQWSLLNTNSRFHYPAIVDFSERLAELLPDGLDEVFLVNSGTEAVDLALRIARAFSGRREVLAVREAYHGWSELSDAVSTSIADNPDALNTRPDWMHTVDAPNAYRGRHRGPEAHRYASDAVARIGELAAAGTPVGTFIAEAYYGNAGGMPLPDGYLKEIYPAIRAHGGLCVADEVQVGYGRLGEWFWGFEQQGVVPDIVAVAKAMGNGHPLGAVITTRAIAESYRSQGYFFSSAGGSPVSSVVGSMVLDVIRDEHLQQNASETGGYLKRRLAELGERHALIGAVHGDGFYLGVEFVRDRETLEPAREETTAICERLRELGVIVQPTSDRQCVLKIKPPLCLTRASADHFVAALDSVLTTGW